MAAEDFGGDAFGGQVAIMVVIELRFPEAEGGARQDEAEIGACFGACVHGAGEIRQEDVARAGVDLLAADEPDVAAVRDDLHEDQVEAGRGDTLQIASIVEAPARHVNFAHHKRAELHAAQGGRECGIVGPIGEVGLENGRAGVEEGADRFLARGSRGADAQLMNGGTVFCCTHRGFS